MMGQMLVWYDAHKKDLATWLCWAFLIAGLLGVMMAKPVGQRAALATTMLNITAASLIPLLAIAACLAILAVFKLRTWAKGYLAFLSTLLVAVLVALTGLGAGATVLRLEADARLQVGSDFVFIGGTIPRDLAQRLDALVHPSVPLNRVILSSSGGSVEGALEAADWIKQRGIQRAVVEGDCASACAMLALLMPERYVTEGASLGLHDVWGQTKRELERTRSQLMARFAANGIPPANVEPLMADEATRFPPQSELLRLGLITGCWSQSERAPAQCSGTRQHPD